MLTRICTPCSLGQDEAETPGENQANRKGRDGTGLQEVGINMAERNHLGNALQIPEREDGRRPIDLAVERHYSIQELAVLWNLSEKTVRRLFENEPGVIEIGSAEARFRRAYVTRRIPESVAQRVHRRLRKSA
jgi:hypothetical protein